MAFPTFHFILVYDIAVSPRGQGRDPGLFINIISFYSMESRSPRRPGRAGDPVSASVSVSLRL